MKTGDVYLNNLLKQYRQQLQDQKKELKTLPQGSLTLRHTNGGVEFVQLQTIQSQTGNKRKRTGITKNEKLIQQLARKKYLQLSVKILAEEIERLEKFISKRIEPTPRQILKMLPKQYRQLPEELFFPQKRFADKWANEPYEQNTKNLHEKKHITSKGLKVRSKSELIIAEKLDAYNIPYRYDSLICYQQYSFSPDFIILTIDGLKYWEHCGMMAVPAYRQSNNWKLSMYEKMGIVPWKNLIVTYDSEDGDLDVRIIESEIKNKLLDAASPAN